MKMDQTFYANHRVGDLMAHATNDVDAVREVAGSGILTFGRFVDDTFKLFLVNVSSIESFHNLPSSSWNSNNSIERGDIQALSTGLKPFSA